MMTIATRYDCSRHTQGAQMSLFVDPLRCREKIKLAPNVMDSLIEGANSDVRQVLNMLSTWKLSHDAMDFGQGKELSVTKSLWFITSKLH
jgi:replication factor C subunit 1